MDGSRWAERSVRRSRGLAVLVVLALLAGVAIAASGTTSSGSGGAQRPFQWLLDVLASLLLVAMALGFVLLVVLVLLGRSLVTGDAAPRRPRNPLSLLLSFGTVIGLLGLALWRISQSDISQRGLDRLTGTYGEAPPGQRERYDPQFQTIPVAVILLVVAVAVVAALAAGWARRRSLSPSAPDLSASIAELIDDTLDDLRAERDPRRAVIAAYARLESVLAAFGAPRRASEAPEEYLTRVLVDLDVPRDAVSRLTTLFTRAKFSPHRVDASMKDEAIEALENVRDSLQSARAREESEGARARGLARESPA